MGASAPTARKAETCRVSDPPPAVEFASTGAQERRQAVKAKIDISDIEASTFRVVRWRLRIKDDSGCTVGILTSPVVEAHRDRLSALSAARRVAKKLNLEVEE